ncbi:DUF262 domain-containing protein [Bradyrhizobium tropiciagri]|uniref:DUF262 domain-containing protein n=1 Tax=Bradyrhizobium tropiciagri TaxID=312253 RepID=UPI001BA77273|nr:DUF262 domain-containing protein [Bradyrhizobium tropiciagri]MBR0873565.1 DUF262 domain-containing protein [Bradyrhizobium tropiciagri]
MSYIETATMKNSTIMFLYSEREEINLSPSYQRQGGVWTLEKRRLLIDSILNDYDLPKIYFHSLDAAAASKTGKRYAVIDGRQRLEAIWDFLDGKFTLASDFEYQRDPSIDLTKLSYSDIAKRYPKIRVKFDSFLLPVVTVTTHDDDLDLIEDMFSRLNEAVPLNAAEKRNAFGGRMVATITEVSKHQFFLEKVRFGNGRYQHKEVAARFLLVEDSVREHANLVDTKKVYLDALAHKYSRDKKKATELRQSVCSVLDVMCEEFVERDELLQAQGIMVVYYLLFKGAIEAGETQKITRRKLLNFRQKLAENRETAIKQYPEASFDLLEFDRLNQQGTNDASSIKERYRILSTSLRIPALQLSGPTTTGE